MLTHSQFEFKKKKNDIDIVHGSTLLAHIMVCARKRRKRFKFIMRRTRAAHKRSQTWMDEAWLNAEFERKRSTFREGVEAKLHELLCERHESLATGRAFSWPYRFRPDVLLDCVPRGQADEMARVNQDDSEAPAQVSLSPLSIAANALAERVLTGDANAAVCLQWNELDRDAAADSAAATSDDFQRLPRNPLLYALLVEARVERQASIDSGQTFCWPATFAMQQQLARALRPDQVQEREERIDELAQFEVNSAIHCASAELFAEYREAVDECERLLSEDREDERCARRDLLTSEQNVRQAQRRQQQEVRAARQAAHATHVARFWARDLHQEARTAVILQFHQRWETSMRTIGTQNASAALHAEYVDAVAACRAQLFHDARDLLARSAVEACEHTEQELLEQQWREAEVEALNKELQEENRRESKRLRFISRFNRRWTAMWPKSEADTGT